MAGIADLVLAASSNKGGRLVDFPRDITEGSTVKWTIDEIQDAAGNDIDLTSATIVCKVVSTIQGAGADTEVLTLTTTGGVGTLTISATSTDTANLAVGAGVNTPRRLWWYCTVTSGGNKVPFWGPVGSPFNIYPAG